jgi:hypothetical protein
MSDKIIEVSNEQDRRKWNRRREDQALVRERRWAVLQAASRIFSFHWAADKSVGMICAQAVNDAEVLLAEIESREQEREKEKE